MTAATQRRRRHLMDPANPVRPVNDASLTRVQRLVLSSLTVVTIAHLGAGLVLAALALPVAETGNRIGLAAIAGLTWVFAVAAARALHGASLVSPWLLAGLVPAAIGFWVVL